MSNDKKPFRLFGIQLEDLEVEEKPSRKRKRTSTSDGEDSTDNNKNAEEVDNLKKKITRQKELLEEREFETKRLRSTIKEKEREIERLEKTMKDEREHNNKIIEARDRALKEADDTIQNLRSRVEKSDLENTQFRRHREQEWEKSRQISTKCLDLEEKNKNIQNKNEDLNKKYRFLLANSRMKTIRIQTMNNLLRKLNRMKLYYLKTANLSTQSKEILNSLHNELVTNVALFRNPSLDLNSPDEELNKPIDEEENLKNSQLRNSNSNTPTHHSPLPSPVKSRINTSEDTSLDPSKKPHLPNQFR